MSTIAVKIKYNTAPDPPPYLWSELDFYDYEILDTNVDDDDQSIIKILGNGKPKIINRSDYGSIAIVFKVFSTNSESTSTLSKLKFLKDYLKTGGTFLLYPKYVDDTDLYYTVILPRKQIPSELAIAGRNSGNKPLTLNFLIVGRSQEIIIDEGEL